MNTGIIYSHLTQQDYDDEIWKPIAGYPNYEISNMGRVNRLARCYYTGHNLSTSIFLNERILKPSFSSKGYLRVCLRANGAESTIYIHRLVAEAFISNPENKPQVNHLNGKADNRFYSLEWTTAKENVVHSWATGLSKSTERQRKVASLLSTGENNATAKLTDIDCVEIKELYATGKVTLTSIADMYGVSRSQVSNIVSGKHRNKPTPTTYPELLAA